MNVRVWLLCFGILGTSGAPGSMAQTAPAFDVASVKPSDPAARGIQMSNSPGMFNAKNCTVKALIVLGYDLRDFQLSGGPGWLDSDRFDIAAKPGGSAEQTKAMVRALLADRFQLAVHRETRTLPVYELTVAKNGPRLKTSADGESMGITGGESTGASHSSFQAVDLKTLAGYLSNQVDRIVIDKTGLQGTYDFSLNWAPNEAQSGSTASDAPSIFTAVQEQLGLKLQSEKGPVEVLVVDRAEKPTPN
jgi:uncharacterized protein (TIGR03435 family)